MIDSLLSWLRTRQEVEFEFVPLGARPRFLSDLRGPIFASVLISLIIAPFTSLAYDISIWFDSTVRTMQGIGLYQHTGFSYPPLYGYWCMFLGGLAHLFGISVGSLGGSHPALLSVKGGAWQGAEWAFPFTITTPLFTLLLKLPMIAADLATGYYVWRIALRLGGTSDASRRQARLSFMWWALNPFVIFESVVHGQIDALAACAIAAAVYYVLENRWALAGVAIGLGVAAKVSPLYIAAPMIGYALASSERNWRNVRNFVVCGMGTGVLALIFEANRGLVTNVFSRADSGVTVIGGLGITGLTRISLFDSIYQYLLNHGSGYFEVDELLVIGSCVAIGIWMSRNRSDTGLIKACLLTESVLLVGYPVLQPEYLLWILPLLVLGVGGLLTVRIQQLKWAMGLVTFGGIYYMFALFGWAEFLAPSSATFGWPNAATIHSSWRQIDSRGIFTWFGSTWGDEFMVFATMSVLIGAGLAIYALLGSGDHESQRIVRSEHCPSIAPRLTMVLLSLATLVCVEIVAVTSPSFASSPSVSTNVVKTSKSVATVAAVVSTSQDVRVSAYAVSSGTPVKRIFFYSSPSRPTSIIQNTDVDITFTELKDTFNDLPISYVDASTLKFVLGSTSMAPGTMVIDVAGTLPNTVWGLGRMKLLTNWIKKGGILVFAGDIPGRLATSPGPLAIISHGTFRYAPNVATLNFHDILPTGVAKLNFKGFYYHRSRTSVWAKALGLRYPFQDIYLSVAAVTSHGGSSLGYVDPAGYTSEAYVPIGRGGVLSFAGEDQGGMIAHDLYRLVKGSWFDRMTSPTSTTSTGGKVVLKVRIPRGASGIRIIVFRTQALSYWTWSRTLTLKP